MLRRHPGPRRAPDRLIHRAADGALSDVETGTAISLDELRDELQEGRYFRATRSDNGVECTNEVLAELIRNSLPAVESSLDALPHPLLRLLGAAGFPRWGDDRS